MILGDSCCEMVVQRSTVIRIAERSIASGVLLCLSDVAKDIYSILEAEEAELHVRCLHHTQCHSDGAADRASRHDHAAG